MRTEVDGHQISVLDDPIVRTMVWHGRIGTGSDDGIEAHPLRAEHAHPVLQIGSHLALRAAGTQLACGQEILQRLISQRGNFLQLFQFEWVFKQPNIFNHASNGDQGD